MTFVSSNKLLRQIHTKEQKIVKDSKEKDGKEKPMMIKRRKQMQLTFPNPKFLASHTIPRP
jgi:hypothetical protein